MGVSKLTKYIDQGGRRRKEKDEKEKRKMVASQTRWKTTVPPKLVYHGHAGPAGICHSHCGERYGNSKIDYELNMSQNCRIVNASRHCGLLKHEISQRLAMRNRRRVGLCCSEGPFAASRLGNKHPAWTKSGESSMGSVPENVRK